VVQRCLTNNGEKKYSWHCVRFPKKLGAFYNKYVNQVGA